MESRCSSGRRVSPVGASSTSLAYLGWRVSKIRSLTPCACRSNGSQHLQLEADWGRRAWMGGPRRRGWQLGLTPRRRPLEAPSSFMPRTGIKQAGCIDVRGPRPRGGGVRVRGYALLPHMPEAAKHGRSMWPCANGPRSPPGLGSDATAGSRRTCTEACTSMRMWASLYVSGCMRYESAMRWMEACGQIRWRRRRRQQQAHGLGLRSVRGGAGRRLESLGKTVGSALG